LVSWNWRRCGEEQECREERVFGMKGEWFKRVIWEEAIGQHWSFQEVKFWTRKALIQVREAYFACYISCMCFSYCFGRVGMCKLEVRCSFSRFLEISRNRLAALKARQATHAYKAYFLGSSMHRLAARYCPPGGTNYLI